VQYIVSAIETPSTGTHTCDNNLGISETHYYIYTALFCRHILLPAVLRLLLLLIIINLRPLLSLILFFLFILPILRLRILLLLYLSSLALCF
jgi:hypothetical protein